MMMPPLAPCLCSGHFLLLPPLSIIIIFFSIWRVHSVNYIKEWAFIDLKAKLLL
jgi:hypothetical protein